MGPGQRSLLARDTASHGVELQAGILRGFDRAAYGLTHERRHLDSSLFDIEDNRSTRLKLLLGRW